MRAARLSAGVLALGGALLAGCGGGDAAPGIVDPHFETMIRPDTPGNNLLFHFDPADMVESFGSKGGRFRVHFTRTGANSVPPLDADTSGIPDFVEEVAGVYDAVVTRYHDDLGFLTPLSDANLPDNGGDDRFDVYLVDFGGSGDGNYQNDTCLPTNKEQCAGYMVEENDFAGYGYPSTLYANTVLGSHEFFHAVQAAYDDAQGSIPAEGTAVWATETFQPSLNDFEGFLPGYLDNPDRSLEVPQPGPTDPFSYGSAIFFWFLEEHYGKGTVRGLWERCVNGANGVANPSWFTELDPLLQKQAKTTFASAFEDFATWNLFTGKFADPTRGYADGAGYPGVKKTTVTAPYSDPKLRVFHASSQYYVAKPGARAAMSAALVAPAGDPTAADGLAVLLAVQRGSKYDPVKRLADVAAGTETIDTAGASGVVAVIVNPAQIGDSKRPGLCVGDVDEIAACRANFLGAGGGGGSGGGSSSSSSSSGGTHPAPAPRSETGSCGCRVAPSTDGGFAAFFPLALAALGAIRRRARRAR